ncbi:MAG: hypothetical protein ACYSUI_05200, partial [Planctomycetota bacterium]
LFKAPALKAGEKPTKKRDLGEEFWIELCGRSIPAKNTPDGVRAVVKDKPIEPAQVRSYLERAFGDDLSAARKAMEQLARSLKQDQLAERAFGLYETFRPTVARGQRGWGQKGELDLDQIRSLGRKD